MKKILKMSQRGFNLIELLVVIAIIGVLSAIALASLNSARIKSADAAIKSELVNIRAQASIYYDSNSYTYGVSATCASGVYTDPQIISIMNKIKEKNGNTALTCTTSADGQKMAISSPLRSSGTWCVDDTGASKGGTASAGVCP